MGFEGQLLDELLGAHGRGAMCRKAIGHGILATYLDIPRIPPLDLPQGIPMIRIRLDTNLTGTACQVTMVPNFPYPPYIRGALVVELNLNLTTPQELRTADRYQLKTGPNRIKALAWDLNLQPVLDLSLFSL